MKKRWLLEPMKSTGANSSGVRVNLFFIFYFQIDCSSNNQKVERAHRTGISGIENHIQQQLNVQHQSISTAFQDLNQLMQQVNRSFVCSLI